MSDPKLICIFSTGGRIIFTGGYPIFLVDKEVVMERKTALTKFLAIAGTVLVWFPLLAPILLSVIFFLQEQIWRIDYLMPAELFFSFLLGSGLLLWASFRSHSQVRVVAWGLGLAVFMLFAGQAIAVATGLASGEAEPAGWRLGMVMASLIVYIGGMILVGLAGIFLIRDLFRHRLSAV
jgi:peptidoglycan/LPS O-acetylase OafA/YrhL